jgi:hypothetical protein
MIQTDDGNHFGGSTQVCLAQRPRAFRSASQLKAFDTPSSFGEIAAVALEGAELTPSRVRDPNAGDLTSLLYDEPPALVLAEVKFRRGSGFSRFLVGCLNGPEVLPALPDDRDAPGSELGGGGLPSH